MMISNDESNFQGFNIYIGFKIKFYYSKIQKLCKYCIWLIIIIINKYFRIILILFWIKRKFKIFLVDQLLVCWAMGLFHLYKTKNL